MKATYVSMKSYQVKHTFGKMDQSKKTWQMLILVKEKQGSYLPTKYRFRTMLKWYKFKTIYFKNYIQ